MTAVAVRTGNVKDARLDDHLQLPEFHPKEFMVFERAACAEHDPNWWLDTSPQNRANRMEAKRICLEECPVLAECREVTDHVERSTHHNNRAEYMPARLLSGIRAGEGPETRMKRRRAAAKERKEK